MRERLIPKDQLPYSRPERHNEVQRKIIYDRVLSPRSQLFQVLESLGAKPLLRPCNLQDVDIVFCKKGTVNHELVPLYMTDGKVKVDNCIALRLVNYFEDPNHYGIDVDHTWYQQKSPYKLAPNFKAVANNASLVTTTFDFLREISWGKPALIELNRNLPEKPSITTPPSLSYEKVTRPNKKISLRQLKISGPEIRKVMEEREVGLTGNPWINRCIIWKTRLKLLRAVKSGNHLNTKEDLLVHLYKILDTNNLNDFNPRIELPSPQSAENELLPSAYIVEFIHHDIFENCLEGWDTQVTYPQISFSKISEITRVLLNLYCKNSQVRKTHQCNADPVIRGTLVHTFQTVAMAIATGQTGRDIQFLLPTYPEKDLSPFVSITEGLSATKPNPQVIRGELEKATIRFLRTPEIFPKAKDFEDFDAKEVSEILADIGNDTMMQGNVIGMAHQIADEFIQEPEKYTPLSRIYQEVTAILNITGNPLGMQAITRFDNLGSCLNPENADCEKYMRDLKTNSSLNVRQVSEEFPEQDAISNAIDEKVKWFDRMMLRYAAEIFNHTFFANGSLQPNGSPLVLKKDYKKWDPDILVARDIYNMRTNIREKLDVIEATPEEKKEFLYLLIHGIIPFIHVHHDQSAFELVLEKLG